MAGWEQELDTLLARLGVQQERREAELGDIDIDDVPQSTKQIGAFLGSLATLVNVSYQTREDIAFVLRDLQAEIEKERAGEEDTLQWAAVLLRFCRVVLALLTQAERER